MDSMQTPGRAGAPLAQFQCSCAPGCVALILLLGVVLGGRKSLWGAFVGATIVALLPNLLSSPALFRAFSAIGFAAALAAGARGLARGTARKFQALAPVATTGALVAGAFLAQNTEDWRRAIFALMLFSVVVGLPEGLMGFVGGALARLLRIEAAPLPSSSPLDRVLPTRRPDGAPLLVLRGLRRHFGGIKAVDGVDLSVAAGAIHGLIGPNGSGKSTLVNLVSGLYAPTGGEMAWRSRCCATTKPWVPTGCAGSASSR